MDGSLPWSRSPLRRYHSAPLPAPSPTGGPRKRRAPSPSPPRRCGSRMRQRGVWWSLEEGRTYVQGMDFAPDIQDGVGDDFVFIPDSEDEDDDLEAVVGGDETVVPDSLEDEAGNDVMVVEVVAAGGEEELGSKVGGRLVGGGEEELDGKVGGEVVVGGKEEVDGEVGGELVVGADDFTFDPEAEAAVVEAAVEVVGGEVGADDLTFDPDAEAAVDGAVDIRGHSQAEDDDDEQEVGAEADQNVQYEADVTKSMLELLLPSFNWIRLFIHLFLRLHIQIQTCWGVQIKTASNFCDMAMAGTFCDMAKAGTFCDMAKSCTFRFTKIAPQV